MLTDRDYELLSDYIDGALTSEERTQIESRLQREPDLRGELEALKATVKAISSLPVYRAPRDFILDTRFNVRPKQRWSTYYTSSVFSALSAAAAVVLITISGFLLSQDYVSQALPAASSEFVAATRQVALNPTEADGNAQEESPDVEAPTAKSLPDTTQAESANANESTNSTLVSQTPLPTNVAPVGTQSPNQFNEPQPLLTSTDQASGAPAPITESTTADALLSQAQATSVPDDGTMLFGMAQEQQAEVTDSAANDLAAAGAAADSGTFATSATSTFAPASTLPPTTVAVLPTTSISIEVRRDQPTINSMLPIGLLVAGLVLLGVAVATTIVRRRNR